MDSNKEYEIKNLNQLSFPRTGYPICDLTGKTATAALITRHCTLYYATRELAEQAWHGIIKKIAHLIPSLQNAPASVGTADERQRREKEV